ncbi:glycosyl transferase [Wukongibacter baidiensis]|uniref:hypothetical protein n=1 Tax=Wukongibacter baidiensis TaxID=1723361 RepID=UPI003D7F1D64
MVVRCIILILSYLFHRLTIPLVENLYTSSGFVKPNYKGEFIPCSMGIIFVFNILLVSLFLFGLEKQSNYLLIMVFILGILAMGFIGLIDDFIGDNDVKGFRGHIKMLCSLKLTTGGLKAVFGGVIAILISTIVSKGISDFTINVLVIALFTNFINLLDLRPGRALKGFLIVSVSITPFVNNVFKTILLSFIGAALAYLPQDIKGKSMLGDIGANSLGIILGIVATGLSIEIKIVVAIFLIIANLYSEKRSISVLIRENRLLSFLDELGRG